MPVIIYAQASFSGYAGVKGDFFSNKDSDHFDPSLTAQTYFAGQLNFLKNFLVRGEFSIETEDIIATGPFTGTKAEFCIDELSATYIKPFLGVTQYFSLFLGTYEPIGSDVFLQRQFGIEPITSLITQSWLGLKGSTAYPFYGTGGSYIVHLSKQPIATGAYIYVNKENSQNEYQLNLDWRFGTVNPWFTLDFALGIGAPLLSKQGDKKVILLIDTLYLHTGVDFLLGNKYSNSLFFQGGFSKLQLKAGDDAEEMTSNEVYLILEPRIVTKQFQAHITFFSMPADSVEKLIFIDDNNTLGLNIAIFTENLPVKNKNITFGFHATWSFKNKDYRDIFDENIELLKNTDNFSIKVSPFLALPVMSGTLHAMLQARITDLSGNSWQDAFKLSIGYKSSL
ncbi:MAG: hypothetical protein IJP62_07850 [Treponema sp.]|nr:hypothetical protein [Treponema sp.]